ncbi:efflux transporter, outer membrane factor (OMF) lipoprotein, NodT family [Cedecea neteri]|uniref:Efflux transporter, outer membrane factor (OMF) lipoprotein, NodT family n=1 Tax=Cedecea neteri TaxID=158822 RepID=A0A2X2T9X9_9ENTR|nr:efflux transporter, outer membrane factor (OMF) lipoprotein, NodT family [Cedecea neteri]
MNSICGESLPGRGSEVNGTLKASAEDLHNTELVIIESISKSYWSIAKLNEQIEFNKQRLDIAKSTYEIVKAKYNSGAGTKSDVILAENQFIPASYSSEIFSAKEKLSETQC